MWQLMVLLVLLEGAIHHVNSLPSHLEPLSYNLTISTHLNGGPSQNRYFGLVSIRLLVREETREVILNYRDIKISPQHTMLIRKLSGYRIGISHTKTFKERDEYLISFKNRLWLGEEYTLYMVFSGNMAKPKRYGYYASFYKDNHTSIGQTLYSIARFDREFARNAFPCFDDPKFRSNFTLHLAYRSDYVPLSNMPASQTWKHPTLDGYLWTTFEESPPLATHMFTWTLHQLKIIAQTVADDGTQVKIWGRPKRSLWENNPMLLEVLEVTKLLLMKTQELFGFDLPMGNTTVRKIDHVVLPQHPRSIYKRGLLIYSENKLRIGIGQKQNLYDMLAEYFVRQWNGILVSVSSWDDASVFDGLTSYLSIQLVNLINPNSDYNQTRLLDLGLWVMEEDLMSNEKPANSSRNNRLQELLRMQKLCLILNMLNSVIGFNVMENGLKNFWHKYANKAANGTQLWNELDEAVKRSHVLPKGIELNQFLKSWLQQPGYPLVIVHRNYEDNTVTISQKRYSGVTWPNKPCWVIPITYMTQSQHSPHMDWLSCDNNAPELSNVTLRNVGKSDEWLLINVNGSILQRTLYDLENWSKLNKVLNTDTEQIAPINRAHIVDDALNLAWMGMLPYSVTLGILSYLPKEKNNLVWQVAIHNLEKLHTIMFSTTGYRIFRTYMRTIVEDHFVSILSEISKDETNDQQKNANKYSRASAKPRTESDIQINAFHSIIYHLACRFEVAACVRDASDRFQASVSDNPKEIPEELRETVYCMAVRYGMEDDWLLVRNRYQVSKALNERRILLRSMACSVDYWALEKLLIWSFDREKVSKLLTVDLLSALAHNFVGFGLVKKYIIEHIDEIKRMYDTEGVLEILSAFGNTISHKRDLEEIRKLINVNLPHASNYTVKILLEQAAAKVDWHQYRYFDLLKSIRQVLMFKDDLDD